MADPVYIDFIMRGMPAVQAALKSVQQAASDAERNTTRGATKATNDRARAANAEAQAKIRAYQKADRWHEQAVAKATKDVARAAQMTQRARERDARDTIRTEEKAAREIQRIKERASKDAATFVRKQEAESMKWVKQEERKRFTQSRDEYRNRRHFAEGVAGAVGHGVMAGAQRVVGAVTHTAGMLGQLGGGFSIDGAVERSAKNAGQLEDLLNSAYNPNSNIGANKRRRDASEVLPQIQGVAQQWGIEREQVQAGARSFTGSTGDLETAMKLLPQVGELARATGASFEELMTAAGGASLQLENVTDSGEKAKLVMQVLRTGAGQGKAGAFELKDQAAVMPKIAAAASKYSGSADQVIPELMALAQGARSGGGAWNAASSATAITALTSTFGKGARLKQFKGMGIDVFADKGQTQLRMPSQIIGDALEKTHGNQEQLSSLFGSVMGMRAVGKMSTIFQQGEKGDVVKDGKKLSGKEAVLDWIKSMTKDVSMTKGDVKDAAGRRMGSLDAKMASQREKFDAAVEQRIIPALLKMVPEFEKMTDVLVDLNSEAIPAFVDLFKTVGEFVSANKDQVRWFASHPIGSMIGMEVTRSVSQALIGEGIKSIISRTFQDAGLGNVFQRVLSSQLGQAGLVAGLATIAIQQGMVSIDNEYKAEDKKREGGNVDMADAAGLTARLHNGTATDADRKKAQELVTKLRGDASGVVEDAKHPGVWKNLGRNVGEVFAPDATRDAEVQERQQQQRQVDELIKTMRMLEGAVRDSASATRNSDGGATPHDLPSGGKPGVRGQSIVNRN